MSHEHRDRPPVEVMLQIAQDELKRLNPNLYDFMKMLKDAPQTQLLEYVVASQLILNFKIMAIADKLFPGQSLDKIMDDLMKKLEQKIN